MLPADLDIAMLEKCCDVLCNPNEETDKEKERTSGILYGTPRNENSTNVRKKTMNSSKVNIHLKSYRK